MSWHNNTAHAPTYGKTGRYLTFLHRGIYKSNPISRKRTTLVLRYAQTLSESDWKEQQMTTIHSDRNHQGGKVWLALIQGRNLDIILLHANLHSFTSCRLHLERKRHATYVHVRTVRQEINTSCWAWVAFYEQIWLIVVENMTAVRLLCSLIIFESRYLVWLTARLTFSHPSASSLRMSHPLWLGESRINGSK